MWQVLTGIDPWVSVPQLSGPPVLQPNPHFPRMPLGWPRGISTLVLSCLLTDPKARPPMSEVGSKLRAIIRDLAPELERELSSAQRSKDPLETAIADAAAAAAGEQQAARTGPAAKVWLGAAEARPASNPSVLRSILTSMQEAGTTLYGPVTPLSASGTEPTHGGGPEAEAKPTTQQRLMLTAHVDVEKEAEMIEGDGR